MGYEVSLSKENKERISAIPVVIPAYEPDDRLITFLTELKANAISPIILVNDGSGEKYNKIFKASEDLADVILTHKQNWGKGAALKTAFQYVLQNYPSCIGVVTADSDGQHSVPCIQKIREQLKNNQNSLILGVRNFNMENIPWKSRFGNKLTRILLSYIMGIKVNDTQTGLRGIPFFYLKDCLNLSGLRFEFEMQMLIDASKKLPIIETPIKTIYDSVQNHKTHFNPFIDSIKIYKFLCYQFIKYIFSSFSSFVLDISLFSFFLFYVFNGYNESFDIILSTFFSRMLSIIYNYTLNYGFVFKSVRSIPNSAMRYLFLAIIQMILSASSTVILNILLPNFLVIGLKIFVDILLFLISYSIQKRYIFSNTVYHKSKG